MNSTSTTKVIRRQAKRRRLAPAAERNRRASCDGKRRYSRREAQAALVRVYRRTGRRMRAYRCDFGEHWHLTSKAKRGP